MSPTVRPESSDNYELLPPVERAEQHQSLMGQEEQLSKPEGRRGDRLAKYTALCSIAVLVTNTWIAVLGNDPITVGWFALHPPLQTLSLALFTYGILTLQTTSHPRTKAAGLARHQAAIFFVGVPSIIFGTSAVAYNKWINQKAHMTTWHGTFGYLSMAWIAGQVGLGGGSVWFGGAAFGGGLKAKAVYKYHRLSGYFLFPMLLLTAHLGGGWSNWGAKVVGPGIRALTYIVAPALTLLSVLVRVRQSKMKLF